MPIYDNKNDELGCKLNNSMHRILLVTLLILTGCAAKFSQANYERIVNVAVASRDLDVVCATNDSTKIYFEMMHKDTAYALEDSAGRGDTELVKMLTSQLDEIERFQTMFAKGPVSMFFCKQKVRNIYDTARLIAIEEGNKLKLL